MPIISRVIIISQLFISPAPSAGGLHAICLPLFGVSGGGSLHTLPQAVGFADGGLPESQRAVLTTRGIQLTVRTEPGK